MRWSELATYAACAAVALSVGWLVARRLPPRQRTYRVELHSALMVVAMIAAGLVFVPRLRAWDQHRDLHASAVALFGNGDAADLYAARLLPLMRDPRLQDRVKAAVAAAHLADAAGEGPAAASMTVLGYAGLARLPPRDLERLLSLRRTLADASPVVCAGLWKGGIAAADLTAALCRLPPADQREWVDLTTRAVALELGADVPAPRIGGQSEALAWTLLLSALPPADRAVIEKVSANTPTASVADACAAFKLFARSVVTQPETERDTLIRATTCPFLIDR